MNSTPASIPWEFTKYDGLKGTFNNYTASSDGKYRYYANIKHAAGASRNQISTSRTINVDNYKSYQIMAWCTNGGVMFIGPTKTKNDWLQNLSTSVEVSMAGTNATNGKSITSDITKLSGDYYFAIQEILTNGKDNSCNINYARLLCQTYSYENPGNISFRETIKSDGKTVTVVYPSGCGSTRTCTYQKDNGEVVEVTSNTVDVNFEKNGNIVAKVTDDNGTMSSSYTVSGITSISVGTVRGGSIKLSKNKSINGENITFTTSPSSGFSYAGATVVCGNGKTHTISDTTAKIGTMAGCDSSAIIYPSWQKDDRDLFLVNVQPPTVTFSQTLVDTSGSMKYQSTYDSNGYKYYYMISNPESITSRFQMGSDSSIDVTDYSKVSIITWCTDRATMMVGITKNRNTWMVSPTGQINADGGVYTSGVSSSMAERISISCDIQKYTGNWYIGVQRLYTNGLSAYCDVDNVLLTGTTYSYTNRGV